MNWYIEAHAGMLFPGVTDFGWARGYDLVVPAGTQCLEYDVTIDDIDDRTLGVRLGPRTLGPAIAEAAKGTFYGPLEPRTSHRCPIASPGSLREAVRIDTDAIYQLEPMVWQCADGALAISLLTPSGRELAGLVAAAPFVKSGEVNAYLDVLSAAYRTWTGRRVETTSGLARRSVELLLLRALGAAIEGVSEPMDITEFVERNR